MTDTATQYWIVVNRNHAGPYTAEQLKEMKISPDTYTWHRGLTQWVAASDITELAVVLWPIEFTSLPEDEDVVAPVKRLSPPAPPARVKQIDVVATDIRSGDTSECPPTYMWWSIVVAVLFSLLFGIIAIVFSARVKKLWQEGDKAGACRYSERAYWLSVIGFVSGLILIPFQIAFMLL